MQFLIYLTVLMISVSTVLLEIHWLTTAPPQPKATVGTAAAPLPLKPEGPNAALSPVYPKKLNSSQQPDSANQQAQVSTTNTSAGATSETITSAQSPATANASAPPQNSPTETNPPTETMGVSTRENETRQTTAAVNPPEGRSSQQSVATGTSPNRCDVQACANAYRSFRASDCSYQPFEGSRRFCRNRRSSRPRAISGSPSAVGAVMSNYAPSIARRRDDGSTTMMAMRVMTPGLMIPRPIARLCFSSGGAAGRTLYIPFCGALLSSSCRACL